MSQDARTFAVNEVDLLRLIESRQAFANGSIDAKRPTAWVQYGYPEEVTFELLYKAYERGGAGHGAVHRILDGCWQELPRIKKKGGKEEKTPWEEALAEKFKAAGLWLKLRDFDRRNLIGRYAALIYRVRDGKQLSEPLVKGSELVDIVPLYENQIEPTAWNNDQTSEDFGKPTMYQYRTRAVQSSGNSKGQPEARIDVHPSRVQILAEGSVGDMYDGVPLLRAGFNALIDVEKISGASGESFLKNSARQIVFQYDPQASVRAITSEGGGAPSGSEGKSVRQVHEEQARALNRNIDASIVMQGGEAKTLETTTADPSKPFEVAANLFAASVQLPFTVLFGQQTGRLASDEDKKDTVLRYKSRQNNELTPMIEQFVKRGQAAGYFDAGEFEVEWPDISEPSDEQKLDNANKMATASKTAFDGGLTEPVFDANEIRKVAGFEPRADDGMPTEEDIAAQDAAAAAALAAGQPGAKPAPGAKPGAKPAPAPAAKPAPKAP